ncbi:hypothetical protein HRbin21_01498 [bacterium HR21]|nr:hypothetical protein HRbin21_01498 [bacterium HR21]
MREGKQLGQQLFGLMLGSLAGAGIALSQTTVTGPGPMSVGTTDATDLRLQTNGTTRVWITSTGNVGIGTAAPATLLHVAGATTLGGNLTVNGSTVTLSGIPGGSLATDVLVRTGSGAVEYRSASGLVGSLAWLLGGNTLTSTQSLGTVSNHDLPIITNNVERVRITATGNVGIGTSTPAQRLHVVGNIQFTGALMPAGAAGTAGQVLVSQGGAAAPQWWTITDDGTGTVVVTPASGQITIGALNNNAIWNANRLQGNNVSSTPPAANQVLAWDAMSNSWTPKSLGSLGAVTGTGTANRLVRWTGTSTVGNGSLDDDGNGVLSRAGNIAINPGAGNTLSTNGNFSAAGTGTFGGQLTVSSGGAAITGNVSVTGNITATGNLTVNGNTTLGTGASNTVTINAGTVTAANLPAGTSNDFVVRGAGGVLQVRTVTGMVTGTGTANRLVRWTSSSTIGDGSLDDNGSGTLSRAGNIAINPGAGNTLSTNGNFSAAGTGTFGGQLTVSSGGAAITGNVSVAGNITATGNLTVNGNTTLGDAATDQVTINAAAVQVPNIPSSSTAMQVVMRESNELRLRSALDPIWNANQLQGFDVSSAVPSAGNILVWNAVTSEWEPNPVTVAGAWSVNGNPGTDPTFNFLGTTDDQPLIIKTNGTERMRIANSTNNGYVGIGVTAPAFRLELPNIANPAGRGRANSWLTYSSLRWKEDIRPLENALDKVMQLQGYSFRWKPEYGGTPDIGFLAEEVARVVPEVVSYEPDGQVAGMDYSRLVALLVEAVKEQQREIAQLRGLVEQLLRERGERGGSGGSIELHDAWLGQNIPNPFEGTTTIPYYIPAGVSRAELVVRDLGGRELRRLELSERGAHGQVRLEMRLLGSGTYEYSLVLDGRVVATRQMTLVR